MIVLALVGLVVFLLVGRHLWKRAHERGAPAAPMVVRQIEPDRGPVHRVAADQGRPDAGGAWLSRGFGRVLFAACGLIFSARNFRAYVAASGIVVFVGPNGSGKSLLAVESLLPVLRGQYWVCSDLDHVHNRPVARHVAECLDCRPAAGVEDQQLCDVARDLLDEVGQGERLVWSTLPLLDPTTGRPHERYRPLVHVRQLPQIEHADVLFDEVAGVSDAEDSSSMPRALTRWLQQLRKRDVFLRVTTPAYERCSKPIRQIAQAVVDCRSTIAGRTSEQGRRWKPNYGVLAAAYDAFEFGTFDKHSGKRLPRKGTWYYWRPAHQAMNSYRTLAQVNALVDVTESGTCVVCNGSKSRPKCACPPGVDELPADQVQIVETPGPRGGRQRRAVLVDGGPAVAVGDTPPALPAVAADH